MSTTLLLVATYSTLLALGLPARAAAIAVVTCVAPLAAAYHAYCKAPLLGLQPVDLLARYMVAIGFVVWGLVSIGNGWSANTNRRPN